MSAQATHPGARFPERDFEQDLQRLLLHSGVREALRWLEQAHEWILEEQIQLTEIPAPTFHEGRRARAVRNALRTLGWHAELDAAGNVVAEQAGTGTEVVLISAHLDTVFPAGTVIRVGREGSRLYGPGIADNGAGLAALLALARVLHQVPLGLQRTLALAANVAEEGEGNLRGMQALMQRYQHRLAAVLVLDGPGEAGVTTRAVASRRLEIVISGPGGHSWGDFGLPNPVHALGRAIARIATLPLPSSPRSAVSVTWLEGGCAINAIPARAAMKVDIRSEEEAEVLYLEQQVRWLAGRCADEEGQQGRPGSPPLEVQIRLLGVRPGGQLAEDAFVLRALRAVDRWLGIETMYESGSTDANLPLSLGIPAVALGAGGQGGAIHTPQEWYDASGRASALQRILLLTLLLAGLEE